MEKEFVRLNIAFIPPDDVASEVVKLSGDIGKKEESYFCVDNLNFYPHITIYSPEYPAYNLEKVLDAVAELSKKLAPIKFIFKSIKTGQGFVGVEFNYSEEIKNIHESIVEKLNPLREGHIREKYSASYQMEFSEEKKKNIQKYGYPNSMSLYHPHMSIARLKDEKDAEKIAGEVTWPIKEFMVDKIGIYRMGNHGTCIELTKEVELR